MIAVIVTNDVIITRKTFVVFSGVTQRTLAFAVNSGNNIFANGVFVGQSALLVIQTVVVHFCRCLQRK